MESRGRPDESGRGDGGRRDGDREQRHPIPSSGLRPPRPPVPFLRSRLLLLRTPAGIRSRRLPGFLILPATPYQPIRLVSLGVLFLNLFFWNFYWIRHGKVGPIWFFRFRKIDPNVVRVFRSDCGDICCYVLTMVYKLSSSSSLL